MPVKVNVKVPSRVLTSVTAESTKTSSSITIGRQGPPGAGFIEVDDSTRWGVTKSVRPVTSGTLGLGTDSYPFGNLYSQNGNFYGDLNVQGDVSITGSLSLSGNFTIGDDTTDSITTRGDLFVADDAFFSDDVNITGNLTTRNVYPEATTTYDLGSATKKWNNIHAKTVHVDGSTLVMGTDGAQVKVVSNRLQFQGNTASDGAYFVGDTYIDAGTFFAQKAFGPQFQILNTNSTNRYEFELDDNGHLNISGNLNGSVKFNNDLLPSSNGGNIGASSAKWDYSYSTTGVVANTLSVGTDENTKTLSVGGDTNIYGDLDIYDENNTSNKIVSIYDSSDEGRIDIKNANSTKIRLAANSNSYFKNGNFGIGTSSPSVKLHINSNDAIKIPVGTTANRPTASKGMIRYNDSKDLFEGYHQSSWLGLGGVIDDDQDTYISTEKTADDDALYFYTAGSERARVASNGNFSIANDLTVSGDLSVSGNFNLGDSTTDRITTQGDLYVKDDAFFSDSVTVTGDLTSRNIYPAASGQYDLGSESLKWDNIYSKTGNFDGGTINLGVGGARIVTSADGSVNMVGDNGVVAEGLKPSPSIKGNVYVETGAYITGSLNVGADSTISGTVTASTPTQNGHLTTKSYVDSADNTLTTNLATTGSNLEAQIVNNDADVSALQTATGSLQTQVTSNDGDITDLNTKVTNLSGDAVLLAGGQTIAGSKTFSDNAIFSSGVTVLGALGVSGNFTLGDSATDSITTRGDLFVEDDAVFSDDMTVTGNARFVGNVGVGVGSATPSATLELGSSAATVRNIRYKDTAGSPTKYNFELAAQRVDQSWTVTPSTVPGGSSFNNPAVTVKNDGNVGIGTSDPTRKLQVESSSNQIKLTDTGQSGASNKHAIFNFSDSSDNSLDILTAYTGGTANKITLSPAGSTAMTLLQGGKVGIGVSAPTQALHIDGNLRLTGAIYDTNNSAGTNGQILISTGSAIDWKSLSEITGVDGTGTANYIPKWSDVDTIGNSIIYDDGTKIGIGTAAPDKLLHLSSNNGTSVIRFSDTRTAMTTGDVGLIEFETFDSGSAGVGAYILGEAGGTGGEVDLAFAAGLGGSATEVMRIISEGKVGIGTSTPSAQLQTTGDVIVGGNLTVSGTTFTVDTSNVLVEDPVLLLAKNQTGGAALDSGFIVERGNDQNVGFIWDESSDHFTFINTNEIADDNDITIASYANIKAANAIVTDLTSSNGYFDWTRNSTSVAAKITQSGTGDILNLFDGATNVFSILDGGNAKAIGNFAIGGGDPVSTKGLYVLQDGGTVNNNSYGLHISNTEANPTASKIKYGLRVDNAGNHWSGNNAKSYGIYVSNTDGTSGVGQSTENFGAYLSVANAPAGKNWGLYTTGEDKNYFSGKVGIGTTDPGSAYKLRVEGATFINGSIFVPNNTNYFGALDSSGSYKIIASMDSSNVIQFGHSTQNNAINVSASYIALSARNLLGTVNETMRIIGPPGITGAGNVGIGTTTPSVSLDISSTNAIKIPVGTTAQRPTAANGMIRLNTTTNQFEGYQNSNWQGLGGVIDVDQDTYVSTEKTSDDDTLFFYTGGSERARISSAGLMGIGTASPSTSLDIGTTDAIKIPVGTTAQRPTAASGMIRLNTTTNQFEGYNSNWVGLGGVIDIDQDTYVSTEKTSDDDTLFFYTANSEKMRIKSDGKVGIGTTAPGATLTLSDGTDNFNFDVTTNALAIKTTTADGADDQEILIDAGSGGLSSTRGAYIWVHGNEHSLRAGQAIYQCGNLSSSAHIFRKAGGTDAVIFKSDGKVGIGTSTPSVQLQTTGDVIVGGNLTVSGTTFTVDTSNVLVEDPVLLLAKNQTGGAALDAGFIIERGDDTNVGFIWDESADQFAVINTTEIADDNDITIASYAAFKAGAATFSDTLNIASGNLQIGGTNIINSGLAMYNLESFKLADSKIAYFGAGNDLKIYHNGSNSQIRNENGNLDIEQHSNDGSIRFYCDDGSGGVELYFHLDGSDATANPQTIFPDNSYLNFGTSGDLQIYHDGSNSYIKSEGVGDLYIQQSVNDKDIKFQCDDGSGGLATYFALDGSDGYSKAHKKIRFLDQAEATFGNADDLRIYHDGSNSHIKDVGTGDLYISANDISILNADLTEYKAKFATNGAVELFHDNSKKLETTSTGVTVAGALKTTTILDTNDSAGTNGQVLVSTGAAIDWKTLSEISGVDGTGTAGYLSKWTDGDTIGNSSMSDNGSGYTTLQHDQNGNTIFKVKNATGGTSADAQLRCESNGSLGLITALSPSYTTSNAYVADSFLVLAASTCSAGLGLAAEGANPINLWTNNTKRMTIDSAGKVGVGTATPSVALDISSTDAVKIPVGTTAQRPTAAVGMMRLNTTTDEFEGYKNGSWQGLGGAVIDVDQDTYVSTEKTSDDDTLFFYTAGAERAKIDNAGNVHVANNLTVSGNLAVSGDFTLGDATTDKITTKGDLYVEDDAFFSDTIRVTGDAYFAGDVGIGTATPSVSLDIVGTDAIKVPAGTDAQRPSAAEGLIRLNTDSDRFEGYNDGNWHALGQGTGTLASDVFTANGVLSGFALSETPNTDKDVLVSVGGVVQTPTTNYVVNSSTLNFTSIPPSGVEIEARHINVGFIHYDDQTIPGDKTFPDDITILGDLSVSGDFTLGDATTDKITTRGDLHVEDDAFFTDKVGIGTTTPKSELDVKGRLLLTEGDGGGTAPSSGAHLELFYQDSADEGYIQAYDRDSSAYRDIRYEASIHHFSVGNVGIGTAAPAQKLHSIASAGGRAALFDGAANWYTTKIQGSTTSGQSYGQMILAGTSSSDKALRIYNAAGSADLFMVQGDGKVGIGTSLPASKLHVYHNTTGEYAAIIDQDEPNAGHGLKVTSDGNGAGSNILEVESGSTSLFRVRGDGRVGIGTASPTKLLHVQGSSPQVLVKSSDATDASVKIDAGASKDSYLTFAQNGSSKWAVIHDYAGTDKLSIYNYANNANRMTFLPDGKVGIGTTSPSALLHLHNGGGDANLRLDASGASFLRFAKSGTTKWDVGTNVGGLSSNQFSFYAQGTGNVVTILQDGNVGIGTTTPAGRLQVNQVASDQSGAAALKVIGTAYGTNKAIHAYMSTSSATKSLLYVENSSGSVLNITGDGKSTFGGALLPSANGTHNLGASNAYWKNAYLEDTAINGTLYVGGVLTAAGGISLGDNDKAIFGGGNDLQIYHDGSNSRITNATGSLWLQSDTGIRFTNLAVTKSKAAFYDLAVELYYDGAKKLETNSGGVTVTGTAILGGASFVDNATAYFGTGLDLRIYHDGNHSYIKDTGTGNLVFNGSQIWLKNAANSANMIGAVEGSYVKLYHNGTERLATTAAGVDIAGQLSATTKSFLIDHPTKPGKKLRHGSLEGPENGVYIRGKSNNNIIELPEYWTELVDEDSITVQLTPMGAHQHIYVESVKDNKVHVQSDEARKNTNNLNYFYLILAERKDVDKLKIEE